MQIFTGRTGTSWGWLLFSGIIGIIAGLAVIRHPLYATALTGNILVILVASIALIRGILGVILAFTGGGWGIGILAALSIIISILLFTNLLRDVIDGEVLIDVNAGLPCRSDIQVSVAVQVLGYELGPAPLCAAD